ncbi:peptidyl-prolyl cis-trans isomerase [Rossellomorea vietnamensis]|uniref:Peptidyl-prolyl cis-trans isomerase n=1 Tax=Rossellomorea vietnamensis TaxID=218284 RepID=A0A5D4MBM2_9BACI|nr:MULTISPECIES: peptidyl-prolyl cis-trans isomerase [Bacillaceae]TYR98415.1 peptidyl-prolyl cis-trans isomerase [Rossellomorea vietnamensis]
MDTSIVPLTGKVKYQITLDPGVWIFDDRKVDLNTYFQDEEKAKNELEEYTRNMSKNWTREIQEGATSPPTLKTEKKYEKEKILTGTFGIPLAPFLTNAQPEEGAAILLILTGDTNEEVALPLSKSNEIILGFSKDGKPLKEDGPVHIFYKDGSNLQNPIKNVRGIKVK